MDIAEVCNLPGCILQKFLAAVYPGKLQPLSVRDMPPGAFHEHTLNLFLAFAHGCQLFYGIINHPAYFFVHISSSAGVHISTAAFFRGCIAFPAQFLICLLYRVAGHMQILAQLPLRHKPLPLFQGTVLYLCH